jgi:UDP-glucose 4-epimerase
MPTPCEGKEVAMSVHAAPLRNAPVDRQSRTVLVTGGAGFIGGHLTRALLARGDRVVVLDDLSTGRMENLADLAGHPELSVHIGDVCDPAITEQLTADSDLVLHLAAVVGVQRVVDESLTTLCTNIRGTEVVLAAADRVGVPVLVTSTSEAYGKCLTLPAHEDDDVLLGASRHSRWCYAASKLVDEFLALAYYHERGLPVVVVRLFNTVGPRQTGRYGMVVPRLVSAALAGQPLPVHGDGLQSRSFLHVGDVVTALLGLVDSPQAVGAVVNIGSTKEVTILELAHRILARLDLPDDQVVFIPYDLAYSAGYEDVRRRVPDVTRLTEMIGWQPRHTLDDIIDDVSADLATNVEPVLALR